MRRRDVWDWNDQWRVYVVTDAVELDDQAPSYRVKQMDMLGMPSFT